MSQFLDRVYNGMPSGRLSMQYTVTGPLIDVDVEDGHFSASCPACPGWTAAADSWNALFDLVSEWHADGAPHRGWSMQPSFIVNGSTTNRVKLEVATPIRAGEGVDSPRYATVEKFADYAAPNPSEGLSRRGVRISLWDRLRNPIGRFLGYGQCTRCRRSWWYQPWGAGVPIDRNDNAIPDETAFRGSSRHALCGSCEQELTFAQRLNWDIVFLQRRTDGDL